jgi:hypothetical protein
MIFELLKEVRATGFFLDKKCTRRIAVITERNPDEIGPILDHSPCKSLTRAAQHAQVSATTAWRATGMLRARSNKIIRVQATEDADYGRKTHFRNWFLWPEHGGVIGSKLTLFTDETWFHLSSYMSAQNNRYWRSNKWRPTFEAPVHEQKIIVWRVPLLKNE